MDAFRSMRSSSSRLSQKRFAQIVAGACQVGVLHLLVLGRALFRHAHRASTACSFSTACRMASHNLHRRQGVLLSKEYPMRSEPSNHSGRPTCMAIRVVHHVGRGCYIVGSGKGGLLRS